MTFILRLWIYFQLAWSTMEETPKSKGRSKLKKGRVAENKSTLKGKALCNPPFFFFSAFKLLQSFTYCFIFNFCSIWADCLCYNTGDSWSDHNENTVVKETFRPIWDTDITLCTPQHTRTGVWVLARVPFLLTEDLCHFLQSHDKCGNYDRGYNHFLVHI